MAGNYLNNETDGGVGKYLLGDISGPSGIGTPDGKVDFYDVEAFSSEFLE